MTSPLPLYTTGEYLRRNPLWHVEESRWKATQILRMLSRHHLAPHTVCEVGCGAGEVLRQLQVNMAADCLFWGYDISPQAIELCRNRTNERLHFELRDITAGSRLSFDLMLVLDVIEHLEDYFTFLRAIKPLGGHTMLHIPLDVSVQTVARRRGLIKGRAAYGHLHYFTKETALETLKDAGYEVIDSFYTARANELATSVLSRKFLRPPRRLLFGIHQDLTVRLLGGYSLLVLAH
jgi:cyclopropane fatty-acyl-phospholipid synthase-like methyltransferase